jgi:hypothetical protein
VIVGKRERRRCCNSIAASWDVDICPSSVLNFWPHILRLQLVFPIPCMDRRRRCPCLLVRPRRRWLRLVLHFHSLDIRDMMADSDHKTQSNMDTECLVSST